MEHATLGAIIVLIIILGPVIPWIYRIQRGKKVSCRRLAGIDALEEAVGRSVEQGRPLVFTTGITGVGPVLYACLGLLHHLVKRAALFKAKLFIPQSDPAAMALTNDIVRDAAQEIERPSTSDVVFFSEEQFAFAAGYMGLVQRENAGATFLMGTFAGESLVLAEAGHQVGAMQVAGCVAPEQVPFFICTCDYTLMGEELFGASAYLTQESVQMGSLCAQDRGKLFIIFMIMLGVLLATYNSVTHNSISLPTSWVAGSASADTEDP